MIIKIKVFIANIITSSLVGKIVGFIFKNRIPAHGIRVLTSSPHITNTNKALLYWGLYEGSEVRFIKKYIKPQLTLIELGSSIGVVGSVIAQKLSPEARMFCVEANPSLISIIKDNFEENGVTNAKVYNNAVPLDETSQSLRFYFGDSNIAGSLVKVTDSFVDVPAIKLSKIVSQENISSFQLVSDIEGAEIGFIMNDPTALDLCELIIIELHKFTLNKVSYEVEMMVDLIKSRGFKVLDRHGPVVVFEKIG